MLTIRPATVNDVAAMLPIYNYCVLHTTAVYNSNPNSYEERRAWYQSRVDQGFPVFVSEIEGVIAGFGSYGSFRSWPGYRYTVEHSVYVDQGWQRRGIGRALIEALVAKARSDGFHSLIGGIDAENTASINLHLALGFTKAGYLPQVGYKFGRWLDLVFMQLLLDTELR